MYYEVYVDVLFLVNFMMDYLLLLLVRKMTRSPAARGRLLLGGVLGAFLSCLLFCLPIHAIFKIVLFHGVVNTLMIRVGLKIKNLRTFARALLLLYIGAIFLGGLLEAAYPYIRAGSLFFAIAIGGYYLALKLWDFIGGFFRFCNCRCRVDLYQGARTCQVKGIIDTGNGLRDPISGEPVSILDRNIARAFLGDERGERVRYIPYHSIGKKEGVLLAIRIDGMHVYGEKECWIKNPLIGVSEETVSAEGEYKMILNPNLF